MTLTIVSTENRHCIYDNSKLVAFIPYNSVHNQSVIRDSSDIFTEKDLYFSELYEGEIMCFFYYNDKWFIANKYSVDAYNLDYRDSQVKITYGQALEEAVKSTYHKYSSLSELLSHKDKDFTYYFILSNPYDTYNVTYYTKFGLSLIRGIRNDFTTDTDDNFIYPVVNFKANNSFELQDKLCNSPNIYGIITYSNKTKTFISVIHSDVLHKIYVRGNVHPNVKNRYYEVRMDSYNRDVLYDIYTPKQDYTSLFDEIENNIYELALYLYRSYILRFVTKEELVRLPKEEYAILTYCHEWYITNRKNGVNNKVTVDFIINILNNKEPSILCKMVTDFKNRKFENKTHKRIIPKSNK